MQPERHALLGTQGALFGSVVGGAGGTKHVHRDGKAPPRRSDVDFLLYVLPVALFVGLAALLTFAVYHQPHLVWFVVVLSGLCSLGLLATGRYDNNIHLLYLGALCVLAVLLAAFVGYANYSWHMRPYFAYLDSREYYNTLPSEPAAAHADASRITFAAGSMIDRTKSVGYNHGTLYCVAPIVDASSLPVVEYWAVGTDCCAQRSEFACDASLVPGVRGGIVQLDSGFLTGSQFKFFHRAVRVAEAAYDIQSSSEPLFIRWYADPPAQNDALRATALWFFAGAIAIHAALNFVMAFGLVLSAAAHDNSEKQANKQDRRAAAGSL